VAQEIANVVIFCEFFSQLVHPSSEVKERRKEGRKEGRKDGRKEGKKEGRKEGRKKGRILRKDIKEGY
jgi:flagellar biosynthesis/type III secretory pathway protein FliH